MIWKLVKTFILQYFCSITLQSWIDLKWKKQALFCDSKSPLPRALRCIKVGRFYSTSLVDKQTLTSKIMYLRTRVKRINIWISAEGCYNPEGEQGTSAWFVLETDSLIYFLSLSENEGPNLAVGVWLCGCNQCWVAVRWGHQRGRECSIK